MKNQLLLIAAFFAFSTAFGQVPNGDFENWSEINVPTLDDWNTIGNVSMSSEAVSGSSAIRLDNKASDASFGIVTNASLAEEISGGVPYTDNPLTLSFSVKYDLAGGDVGKVVALFKKQGNYIASVDFTLNGNSGDTFELYKVPIQWIIQTSPDSVVLAFSTIDFIEPGINGDGYMIIDNLKFLTISTEDDNVSNADFENWSSKSLEYPTGWYTTDLFVQKNLNYPGTLNSVVKESMDPHDGVFSVKLKNQLIDTNMIPGVMVTGTSIENAEKPAFAVSSDWSVLHGLYKYQPDSGDTAYIAVALFSNGTVVMQGELYLTDSTRMDQYTYFSIKLSTTGVGNIDSGTIVFSSSSFDYAKGLNSTLYIDNVQLAHHTLSVSSPESIPLFIYPNPSAGLLRVECGLSAFSYQIYNAEGAVVLNGTDQDIDLSSLRSGIYYIQLSDGTNLSSRTKIIKL